jgi:hypothetical protein
MIRNFYIFGLLCFFISLICGLLHSFTYFHLDEQMMSLKSLPQWLALLIVLYALQAFFCLRYYHFKQYRLALITGMIAALAYIINSVVAFTMLTIRQGHEYYIISLVVVILTGFVYGVSLIFPNPKKGTLIHLIGICTIAANVMLAIALFFGAQQNPQSAATSLEIVQWAILVGNVIPLVLFILFYNEMGKVGPIEVVSENKRSIKILPGIVTVVTLTLAIVFSLALLKEVGSTLAWQDYIGQKNKEWERLFERHTFRASNGNSLNFQLLKPLNFDSLQQYPLVVCLPYAGGVEGAPLAQYLLTDTTRSTYNCFLFVPYCADGHGWGGIPGFTTVDIEAFECLDNLVKEIQQIDEKRIYVGGISKGGFGAWHFISSRPDLFAAAIPISGGGDKTLARSLTDLPVWAFHGTDDPSVPAVKSREMIDEIQKAGGHPKYTEFANEGHDIWNLVTNTPGLLDWLFSQSRRSEVDKLNSKKRD